VKAPYRDGCWNLGTFARDRYPWFVISAVSEGEGLGRRRTLRNLDILTSDGVYLKVGVDVALSEIYPDLWDDWHWHG
jgi:hypothetical protein